MLRQWATPNQVNRAIHRAATPHANLSRRRGAGSDAFVRPTPPEIHFSSLDKSRTLCAGGSTKSASLRPIALSVACRSSTAISETSTLHTSRYPTVATFSMKRGSLMSSPSRRRSSQMQRVREPSVTAVSPQTEFSSSSFEINFWGLRSKSKRTRNAFGSTANTLPALRSENSRSRTSTSEKRKTKDLFPIIDFIIRLSDSEDPRVLRPVYFERIDFLGADITGKQERVVRSKSKPSPKRSGGQASEIL